MVRPFHTRARVPRSGIISLLGTGHLEDHALHLNVYAHNGRVTLNIIGAVTAGAAALAAILAGLNLYFSGQRELDKWIRETLVEIFVPFLDASFKHASACRRILSDSPSQRERTQLQGDIFEAHTTATQVLTRLRLLAPPSVVEDAIALLEAEYLLARPCFLDSVSNDDTLELIRAVRHARTELLVSARSALGLRAKKGTGDFELNLSWRELRNSWTRTEEVEPEPSGASILVKDSQEGPSSG